MEALTPGHLVIILIAFIVLAGYKKLPDASRSIGRSLRIFRSEMQAADQPATGDGFPPSSDLNSLQPARTAGQLEAEAAAEELRAAELRARAASPGGANSTDL